MKVAFFGLGRMGMPMALNLASTGIQVIGVDPVVDGSPELESRGIHIVNSLQKAADADVSVSVLADDETTRDVICGPGGLGDHVKDGHTHVLMGTVEPDSFSDLISACAGAGISLVDAPVSGSVGHAEKRELTTMVGGSPQSVEMVMPVLRAMTKLQFHVGAAGAGMTTKLGVNLVLGCINEAVSEALTLMKESGLPLEGFYDVLQNSAAAAPYIQYKRDAFLSDGEPQVTAPIQVALKDLDAAANMARQHGLHLPAAAATREVLAGAVRAGDAHRDLATIREHLVSSRGSDLRPHGDDGDSR